MSRSFPILNAGYFVVNFYPEVVKNAEQNDPDLAADVLKKSLLLAMHSAGGLREEESSFTGFTES